MFQDTHSTSSLGSSLLRPNGLTRSGGSGSGNCKLSLAGWVLRVIQRRGVAGTNVRSIEAAARTGRRRGNGSGRKVATHFRGPNGQEYSGRGAIPKWAKELGVDDRAGRKSIAFAERLYAHRIFTSLGGPGVVRRTQLLRRAPTKQITAIGEPFAIANRALEPVWFASLQVSITVNQPSRSGAYRNFCSRSYLA